MTSKKTSKFGSKSTKTKAKSDKDSAKKKKSDKASKKQSEEKNRLLLGKRGRVYLGFIISYWFREHHGTHKHLPFELIRETISFFPMDLVWRRNKHGHGITFISENELSIHGEVARAVADGYIDLLNETSEYVCWELKLDETSNCSNLGFVPYPLEPLFERASACEPALTSSTVSTDSPGEDKWWNSWMGHQSDDFCIGFQADTYSFSRWKSGTSLTGSYSCKDAFRNGDTVTLRIDVQKRVCDIWVKDQHLGTVFEDIPDAIVPCVSNYKNNAKYVIRWVTENEIPKVPNES